MTLQESEDIDLINELEVLILKELESHTWDDTLSKEGNDDCVYDLSGSNVGDAYEAGIRSGNKIMAQWINGILLKYGYGVADD
jgi:hypothetical protein